MRLDSRCSRRREPAAAVARGEKRRLKENPCIRRIDATHGTLTGDLTLAGVTKPVTLKLRVNKIGKNDVLDMPSVGFTATTTIKRSAFGIRAYEDLVGDAISVQIQIEALEGPDPEAAMETATQPAK